MPEKDKVRRLFLCRHGKTVANEKGIYCGGSNDSPINQIGRTQASLLGKALKNYYKFCGKIIVSSEMERARETAEIISQSLGIKLFKIVLRGLREMELGYWCGKSAEEIQNLFPKEHEEWLKGNLGPDFRFPGGESMKESGKRVTRCFNIVKEIWLGDKDETNNDLIMVTHGGTNMIIMAEIMNAEMKTYGYRIIRQDNACMNIACFCEGSAWRPKVQITLLNSTHHLDCELR